LVKKVFTTIKRNPMWDIKSSQFYKEVMTALTVFFARPEASESELHQELSDAGTLEAIKRDAMAAAEAAVSENTAQLKAQVESLGTSFKALETEANSKDAVIESLNAELAEKAADLELANEKLAAVSAELATVKVSKPIFETPKPDASLPIKEGQPKAGNTMTMEQLMAHMN